jgi:hypothetical protein
MMSCELEVELGLREPATMQKTMITLAMALLLGVTVDAAPLVKKHHEKHCTYDSLPPSTRISRT